MLRKNVIRSIKRAGVSAAAAERVYRRHRMLCAECTRGTGHYISMCETGYDLYREWDQARKAAQQVWRNQHQEQGTLWEGPQP